MDSKIKQPPGGNEAIVTRPSPLTTSAGGTSLLIGLQVGSRALTFLVNQILLRYLSPELLGISTQFDVYSISVLFFSRESLRVAIQRQADVVDEPIAQQDEEVQFPRGHVDGRTSAGRTQAIVNLSYLSIFFGIFFALFFAALYNSGLRSSNPAILNTPYFGEALKIYAIAAIWELLSEPCYVVVTQKSRVKIRVAAEGVGTLIRCLVTCGSAIWAARMERDLGVLPFAFGQGVYAISLLVVYYWSVWGIASAGHFSLVLKSIYSSEPRRYLLSYFSWTLLSLSGSLFAQGILKHFLTQGDTFIISALASARDQGIYALAANYGGLIARLVLQPIEESSRMYFGKLLSSSNGTPTRAIIEESRKRLQVFLEAYVLLSVCVLSVGPTLAPLLLKIVAGSRWTTSGAGDVLATYCYYIPMLAINGLMEAFVSSVATEKELNRQSIWMFAFSAGFASAAFFFLRFLEMGAEGLVWANVLNMVFRIVWSSRFVSSYMKRNGTMLTYEKLLPRGLTIGAAVVTARTIRRLEATSFTGSMLDVLKAGGVTSIFMGVVLISERHFILAILPTRITKNLLFVSKQASPAHSAQ